MSDIKDNLYSQILSLNEMKYAFSLLLCRTSCSRNLLLYRT